MNVDKILTASERTDKNRLIAAVEKRLLQTRLNDKQEAALRDYLASSDQHGESEIRGLHAPRYVHAGISIDVKRQRVAENSISFH